MNLYEIAKERKEIEEILADDSGEITLSIEDRLLRTSALLAKKTDSCVYYVEKTKNDIEFAKNKIDELKAFIKYRENEIERFSIYVKQCLVTMGKESVEGDLHSIKIRQNPHSVDIIDEEKIPAIYKTVVQTIKIDKNMIKNKLKAGLVVDGASLSQGTSISFGLKKVK